MVSGFFKFPKSCIAEFRSSAYTNNPAVIARQHKMVAINSAIEIDITGQIVSDSIGPMFYSGLAFEDASDSIESMFHSGLE